MAREIACLGAVAAVLVSVAGAAPGHADPAPVRPPGSPGSPQYIDHVVWEQHGERSTLRIYPTPWGWSASGVFTNGAQSYDAWAELLQHAPEANTLSMQKQFLCYWQLSTFTNPGKVGTWNLEPWRTVVPNTMMLNAGCNPGGAEDVPLGT